MRWGGRGKVLGRGGLLGRWRQATADLPECVVVLEEHGGEFGERGRGAQALVYLAEWQLSVALMRSRL